MTKSYGIAQTSYGPIQYLDIGPKDGVIVLFSTGGGTGFDAARAFQWVCREGYRMISVNRPGYFDLPIAVANSIEEHADIYHAVIQSLGITTKIQVFGISMGGLSALYYASKYPTTSLVLWSAITGAYQVNEKSANSLLGQFVLKASGKRFISWMLMASARFFPKQTIQEFLKTEADLNKIQRKRIAKEVIDNPESKKEFMIFIKSMTPMEKLYDGMMDEVVKAQNLQQTDWTTIECPVYAVHSTIDIDVGLEHPKRLEKMIPNLKMEYVKGAGHFVWWGKEGEAVKKNTVQFLNDTNTRISSKQ